MTDGSDTERVVMGVPSGVIHDSSGWVFDLNADIESIDPGERRVSMPWSVAVESLTEWFKLYDVPLISEHGKSGGVAHGVSTRTVVVNREEAAKYGITLKSDECFLVIMDFRDPVALADNDAGRSPYQSPWLVAGYVDQSERRWPLVIKEISRVTDPRNKTNHPVGLHEARMSDTATEGVPMAEDTAAPAAMTIDDRVSALEQTVADLASTVAAMTAAPEAEEVEEVEVPMSDDSEVAKLRAEVARLTTLAKRSEAAALLAQAKGERDFAPDVEAKFADIFVENEAHARLLIVATPKRGATNRSTPINGKSTPSAPTVDATMSDLPSDPAQRTLAIAARLRAQALAKGETMTAEQSLRAAVALN